ncbi:MAG: glucosaminidase domain-containing protein [Candidatus Puniceispirillaceae bacterium]
MFFLRRIENRHILWTALSLVAIGLIVPGGFGIKPPQWLNDRQPQDVASVPASDLDADDLSTSAVTSRETLDVEDGLRPAQQALALALSKPDQAKPDQTSVVIVPSKFARHIPAKHFEMTGDAQKQSFINLVLPLILAANDELLQRREAVQAAVQAHDRDKLDQWAVLYRIEAEKLDDTGLAERLLRRVDTIPVALALAQAAVESGWGTSRFARQGNALFGQWAWTESAGMRPLAASNDRAVVRSFGSLLESVRAYMHNLNTHQNYKRFRDARYRLKPQTEAVKARRLAAYLDSYAEIGQAYVEKLLVIISSNNFDHYAEAKLG